MFTSKSFTLIVFFCIFSTACVYKTHNREALFIILGAGGRIDQEYNLYAQSLNKEGYKIVIHSFDPYYGNDGESIDKELDIKIKECTAEFNNCEFVKDKFDDARFLNINYTIYENSARDFIFAKRNSDKNNINLFRYTTGVKSNNRNGIFIKKIVSDAIEQHKRVVFIDSVWCGGFQPITKQLFKKYKNNMVLIHAVHNKVQIITEDLIKLSEEENCQNPKSILDYKYKCVDNVAKFGEGYFNENSKIYHNFYKKYNKFQDMSKNEQNKFIQSVANGEEFRVKFWNSASCINDILNQSNYTDINSDIVNQYLATNPHKE